MNDEFALLALDGKVSSLGKELWEEEAVAGEGGEDDGFPGAAGLCTDELHGASLAFAADLVGLISEDPEKVGGVYTPASMHPGTSGSAFRDQRRD